MAYKQPNEMRVNVCIPATIRTELERCAVREANDVSSVVRRVLAAWVAEQGAQEEADKKVSVAA